MKLVLDTNIYIAALFKKSLASDILRLGEKEEIEIFVSPQILKELITKLSQKAKFNKAQINEFVDLINQCTAIVIPKQKLDIIKRDPDDNIILECAVEAEADLIVSMDKDLLKLKVFGKTGIVHPRTLTWILPKLLKS